MGTQYLVDFLDLKNTPGIYYAIGYWLATITYIHTLPGKGSLGRRWGVILGLGSILAIIMIWTKEMPVTLFIPLIMLDLSLVFLMFYLSTDIDIYNVFYYTLRAFILGEFVASIEWQLYYYGLANAHLPQLYWLNLVLMIPVYIVLFGAIFMMERRLSLRYPRLLMQSSHTLSGECSIVFLTYMLSNLSFALPNTPFTTDKTAELLLIRTLADLAGVVILYFYHVVLHTTQDQIELVSMQNLLDMQYNNYRISKESVELINRKYHDLKHQIEVLKADVDTGRSIAYLEQMEEEIRSYEAQNKTGNMVLDIILTSKSLLCQRHGITLTVVADGKELDFMDTIDISSIFGNILDNAIEGTRTLVDRGERLIHLTIVSQKGFVQIYAENRFSGSLRFIDGLPKTTKKQTDFHGYGIKSIKTTVEKYGGSVQLSTEDGWFHISILLPKKEWNK